LTVRHQISDVGRRRPISPSPTGEYDDGDLGMGNGVDVWTIRLGVLLLGATAVAAIEGCIRLELAHVEVPNFLATLAGAAVVYLGQVVATIQRNGRDYPGGGGEGGNPFPPVRSEPPLPPGH
jgi:hypothetical protein